jgi:hypothetical protein
MRTTAQAATVFAVARLRRWRRDQVLATLSELSASALVVGGVVLLALGLRSLAVLADYDAPPVPAVLVPWVLLAMVAGIVAVPALLVGLLYASVIVLVDVLRAPALVRWLLHRRRERALEEALVRQGWLPAGEELEPALRRLLEREPELVVVGGRVRVVGPVPDDCPSCGAPLSQPGPGLRACGACGYDRYDPLPGGSARWAASRVQGPTGLLERVRARHPRFDRAWGIGRWVAVGMGAGALLSSVGWAVAPGASWATWPVAVSALLAQAGVPLLGWCGWAVVSVGAAELPGLLVHRRALRDELLRLTAVHGAVRLDEAASRLGVPVEELAVEVSVLTVRGDLPVYHDQVGGRLVSRFCEGADSRCGACGGQAEPGPRGLVCGACGAVVVGLRVAR